VKETIVNKPDPTPREQWAGDLESLSKKLQSHAKAILAAGEDPFAQREQIERTAKTLSEVDTNRLTAPDSLRKVVDTQCLEARAEFWQQFCANAQTAGWEVHGSTDRRLVSRAIFVELKNDAVTIDAAPGRHSPYVPSLIQTLKPHVDVLKADKGSLRQFVDMLAQAYDMLGGHGDITLEAVFRQCILLIQSPAFWVNTESAKFQELPRPVFRYRLSAALSENIATTDGREFRLMPTVNRKDYWELFSPVEGRVVQVGRLSFLNK
jgi:hypothetical protein